MDDLEDLPKILAKSYTYYDVTGRILANYHGTMVDEMDKVYSNCQRIEGTYSGKQYYILEYVPTIRPIQETIFSKTTLNADGIDVINITFPYTGTLAIRGVENLIIPIAGNETFTTTITGIYYININAFPYLDFNIKLEAI